MLLSKQVANAINTSADYDYIEINLGAHWNTHSRIGVGTLIEWAYSVSTPDILDENSYKHFWLTWENYIIKVGVGFVIGHDVILEKTYPSTVDFNYLSLFNGWGAGGSWKMFLGKQIFVTVH